MTDTPRIPRPHVSYGPRDMPVDEADAMYLREAARNITHSRCMGSNLTATVVKLLNDCADAIDHPAPSPRSGLCVCGKPGCSDGSDTADEPVCCHTTHGGPINRDECHRCRVESSVPSSAPEDEQEELAQIVEYAHRTGPVSVGEPSMARESADLIIAAGWRSPTEVAALVDEREAKMAGEIRRHARRMESYTLPAISPGFIDGYCHALRLLHRDADFIAARAATKAAS